MALFVTTALQDRFCTRNKRTKRRSLSGLDDYKTGDIKTVNTLNKKFKSLEPELGAKFVAFCTHHKNGYSIRKYVKNDCEGSGSDALKPVVIGRKPLQNVLSKKGISLEALLNKPVEELRSTMKPESKDKTPKQAKRKAKKPAPKPVKVKPVKAKPQPKQAPAKPAKSTKPAKPAKDNSLEAKKIAALENLSKTFGG